MKFDEQSFADRAALRLLGTAVQASAAGSIIELGEISLRDDLVIAAAAEAASKKTAWIIERERAPENWGHRKVDLKISRNYRHNNKTHKQWVTALELKWWRNEDNKKVEPRINDLVKDFFRMAGISESTKKFDGPALVALISTRSCWEITLSKTCSSMVKDRINAVKEKSWPINRDMKNEPAVAKALKLMKKTNGKWPANTFIPSSFRTKLLTKLEAGNKGNYVDVRIWSVWKPQGSSWLDKKRIHELSGI